MLDLRDTTRLDPLVETATDTWRRLETGSEAELYVRFFKSTTPGAESFLHDPLSSVSTIDGVGQDWQVATMIDNHQRTLNYRIIEAFAIVQREHKRVLIAVYKRDPRKGDG